MILIDTSKSTQQLVLTLTEKTSVEVPEYLLVIANDATKEQHQISLADKLIISNPRYDLFELQNDAFDGLSTGFYSYSIYQDANQLKAIETGKLLIKANEDAVEIISPIRTEEYIIYK